MNKKSEGNLQEVLAYVMVLMLLAIFVATMAEECDRPAEAKEFPYKTAKQAVAKGISWGNSKIIKSIKFGFELYHPWFRKYGGGVDPVYLASIAMTETAHTFNPYAYTKDSKLGETGLLSITRDDAREFGYDACYPPANILMAAMSNQKYWKFVVDHYGDQDWFKKASYADQWMFVQMWGGAGGGAVNHLLKLSAADAKSSKAKKQYPIFRILNFLKLHGSGLDDPEDGSHWGRQTLAKVAFRIARIVGQRDTIIKIYGSVERWQSCVQPRTIIAKDYSYLPKYPGDDNHGHCCKNWMVGNGKSKAYACWREKWDMPSYVHRKQVGESLKYLFRKYCVVDGETGWPNEKCSMSDMLEEWKRQKQEEGMLPSDQEYEESEAALKAAGCWILDEKD